MKQKYDDILNSMKNAFFEESGKNPDSLPDVSAKFEGLASELFAVSSYGYYIIKQAFVQSAAGEYLDMHAAQRGLERKTGSKAQGELVFSVAAPLETDIIVHAGTVCSVSKQPFAQFETLEEAVIKAGEMQVSVCAQALEDGVSFNVASGAVDTMVNPPGSVKSVTNTKAFFGGCFDENDEAFRMRILANYSVPENGVNTQSLVSILLKLDEVLDCTITGSDTTRTAHVYVKTRTGDVSKELETLIRDTMGIVALTGSNIIVKPAQRITIGINCKMDLFSGYDIEEMKETVSSVIRKFCSAERLGHSLSMSHLSSKLSEIEGVRDFVVYSANEYSGSIPCDVSTYLALDKLEVVVNA